MDGPGKHEGRDGVVGGLVSHSTDFCVSSVSCVGVTFLRCTLVISTSGLGRRTVWLGNSRRHPKGRSDKMFYVKHL